MEEVLKSLQRKKGVFQVIAGQTNSGKSQLCIELSKQLLSKDKKVLTVNTKYSREQLQTLLGKSFPTENLKYLKPNEFFAWLRGFNLKDLKSEKPDWIIVDNANDLIRAFKRLVACEELEQKDEIEEFKSLADLSKRTGCNTLVTAQLNGVPQLFQCRTKDIKDIEFFKKEVDIIWLLESYNHFGVVIDENGNPAENRVRVSKLKDPLTPDEIYDYKMIDN